MTVVGLVLLSMLAVSACGSSGGNRSGGSEAPDGGKSIKIGAVGTLTGVSAFPQSTQAAQAVFDQVNAAGGINGHKIEYIVKDDGGVATQGAAAARTLVTTEHVVAMAGSTSVSDCATNGQYYQAQGILDVPGQGIDAGCFNSPAIGPVNVGPYYAFAVALYYVSEVKKLSPVCLDVPNAGIPISAYQPAIDRWEKATGKKLAAVVSAPIADDPAPGMAKLKSAGCKGIVIGTLESSYPAYLKAAQAAGLYHGTATVMGMPSGYTLALAKSLGSLGNGFYSNSEFAPYTIESAATKPYLDAMKTAKIEPSAFGEGGYIAAQVIVAALKNVKGPYTAASVSAALKSLNYTSPLLARPYKFGPQPNKSLKIMQLNNGGWSLAEPNWITLE